MQRIMNLVIIQKIDKKVQTFEVLGAEKPWYA